MEQVFKFANLGVTMDPKLLKAHEFRDQYVTKIHFTTSTKPLLWCRTMEQYKNYFYFLP